MKALFLILTALPCLAQTEAAKPPEQPRFFRVDFVVKEIEGTRVVNSRTYGMNVSSYSKGSIRSGDKVPVPAARDGSFTFLDVGVNIDWQVDGVTQNQQVPMHVAADISNVTSEKPGAPPVIGQTKSSSNLIVPLRRETNVFSADSTTTKRQMQLDVTVTPIP